MLYNIEGSNIKYYIQEVINIESEYIGRNLSLLDDEDVFFPGQFDADNNEKLTALEQAFEKSQADSEKESKFNRVVSLLSLSISVIALFVSLIPLIF